MPVIVNKRLLDVKSASNYLSISKSLLYQLHATGKILSLKINTKILFDVDELDQYVKTLKNDRKKTNA
jgi:excisionase family DNA binding protein